MTKNIESTVENMTVAEMRKEACKYNIKNANKYKRVELQLMLVKALIASHSKENLQMYSKKELIELMKQYHLPYCHHHRSDNKPEMISRLSEVLA